MRMIRSLAGLAVVGAWGTVFAAAETASVEVLGVGDAVLEARAGDAEIRLVTPPKKPWLIRGLAKGDRVTVAAFGHDGVFTPLGAPARDTRSALRTCRGWCAIARFFALDPNRLAVGGIRFPIREVVGLRRELNPLPADREDGPRVALATGLMDHGEHARTFVGHFGRQKANHTPQLKRTV